MKKKAILNLIIILFFCGSFDMNVFAQEKKTSTSANKQDKTKKKETLKLLLDQIEVRGWIEKPQTARLVRQRIRTVLNWARTAGHFEGVNPVEGVEEGLAKQKGRVKHYAAMPWGDVPGFMNEFG